LSKLAVFERVPSGAITITPPFFKRVMNSRMAFMSACPRVSQVTLNQRAIIRAKKYFLYLSVNGWIRSLLSIT